jgi:ribosome-binding factor A
MASRRVERVQRAIREAVCEVLMREVKDPRWGFVTVTRVEATGDLRQAKVYFSVLGSESDERRVARLFTHARGFIQREVGRRLPLRFCPVLTFAEDVGLKEGFEVTRLIEQTRLERESDATAEGEDERGAAGPDPAP